MKVRIIKVVALDQASSISGVAVFSDNKLTDYDLIDLHKDKNMTHRVCKMMRELNNYIIKNKPDYVVFEGVSLQTNVSTLLLLAQIQGAIMQTCVVHNIPYTIYKPTEWRSVLHFRQGKSIKRAELKRQAQEFVFEKYNLTLEEDICDAICIGKAFVVNKNDNIRKGL